MLGESDAAKDVRAELKHRVIWMTTAQAWGLGQRWITFKNWKTGVKESANAIIIPWRGPDGLIKAIQYRLLNASRRYHAKYGGEKTIFGAHLLTLDNQAILFVCEGELNAISIWQAAREMGLRIEVISIGGEGVNVERLMALQRLAMRYRGAVVWLDREEIAVKVGYVLTEALLVKSPGGRDANALAIAGKLDSILEALVQRFDPTFQLPPSEQEPADLDSLLISAATIYESLRLSTRHKALELYQELEIAIAENHHGGAHELYAQLVALSTRDGWQAFEDWRYLEQNALFQ